MQLLKTKYTRLLALPLLVLLCVFAVPHTVRAATAISITSPTSGSTANGSSFTVTGTATPVRNITVKVNNVTVGTTLSDGSGNWSLNVAGQTAGAKTIEATASYQQLYVNSLNVGSLSNSVMTKINTIDDSIGGTFSLFSSGSAPLFWRPNSTFTKAYGAAGPLGSPFVYVIDLANETTTSFLMAGTSPNPSGAAYSADDSKVYMNDFDSNNDIVRVYNTTTDAEIGVGIPVGDTATSVTRRPGTNEIWVTNGGDSTISIIDTISDTVVDTYTLPGIATCVSFNPSGSKAYASNCGGGPSIYVLDGATGATTDTITASGGVGYVLTTNYADTKLYVPILGGNSLDVFDTSDNTLIQNVPGFNGPLAATINSDDSKLYVSNANPSGGFTGNTLSVLDTSNNTIVKTITVTAAPSVSFLAPVESATDTIELTLSSSAVVLANTGQDTDPIILLSYILLTSGLALATYTYNKQRRKNV